MSDSNEKVKRIALVSAAVCFLGFLSATALWFDSGNKLSKLGFPEYEVVPNTTGDRAFRQVCSDTEEKCNLASLMQLAGALSMGGLGGTILSLFVWHRNRY